MPLAPTAGDEVVLKGAGEQKGKAMNSMKKLRAPAVLALALWGFAPRLAAADEPPKAPATPIAGTAAAGYPRSGEGSAPPPGSEGAGSENGPNGKTYDTNWVFTASRDSTDVVAFHVTQADIDGWGNETNSSKTADHRAESAWGADRRTFRVPAADQGHARITVENPITIYASWHLMANGRNVVDLRAVAYDLTGKPHTLNVLAHTNVPERETTDEGGGAEVTFKNAGTMTREFG